MNLICSNCREILLPEHINVSTNLGKCLNCHTILKLNELESAPEVHVVSSTPPTGSSIIVNSNENDDLRIHLPKKGITIAHLPTLAFATFWLIAIGFFTYISFGIDLLPVLFSIPFWTIGILMILGVIKGTQESQKVIVSKDVIRLEHTTIFKSSTSETKLDDIQEVTLANSQPVKFSNYGKSILTNFSKGNGSSSSELGVPTILSYANSKTFFESTTEENQVWITTLLNDIVKRHNN
jgi:hypothetical protein